MNGKTSGLFCAIVKFEDSMGNPLSGDGWSVDARDQDMFLDDCLGSSGLDENGKARILISVADIMSPDSVGERTPDLYFTLYRNEREIFRSEVIEDVDFESLDPVSGDPVKITREFGPYRVDTRD
jgi:hypothetical protein